MTDEGGTTSVRSRPRQVAGQIGARPVLAATIASIVIVIAYLLAPNMGGDLSAQIAHADFARDFPMIPVDFRWFGGIQPFGYSLWTPAVMAVVGVRLTGALVTVAAVAAFTYLLRATGARRPFWGGAAVAITLGSNLAEGRVTFACGVAAGLGALAALYLEGNGREWRHALAGILAIVAGAASPVAAAFLVVCAGALLARARVLDAISLSLAVLPVAVMVSLFGDGGRQVFGGNDAIRALVATAIVAAAIPSRLLVLRVGAVIGLALVLIAYFTDTPIGSNAARLSLLFAVPLAIAYVSWTRWIDVAIVVAVVVAQTPITFGTLAGAGKPVTTASYFAPLAEEISRLGPLTGRVEVPELTGHWDAAYLARDVPLARGWFRQLDTELNDDVFYTSPPTPQSYRDFLDRSAVQYVAVADARPTYYGRREVTLIDGGLTYLSTVWSNEHWTLYAVTDPTPIVELPGRLVSYQPDRIIITAPPNSEVTVHIRDFRWLSVSDSDNDRACLTGADGDVVLHTRGVRSQYTITSGLWPGWFDRC